MKKKMLGVENIIGMTFFIVGLALVAACVLAGVSERRMKQRFESVQGVITELDTYKNSDGELSHRVRVGYFFQGQKYEEWLSEYSSSMYEGQDIQLYVDPEHPKRVKTTMLYFIFKVVFGSMGAVFALIGGSIRWNGRRKKNRQKKLKETGTRVYAQVSGGHLCVNYTVGSRHPYQLECRYTDVFSGETCLYISDYTWENPEAHIGRQVTVYVDPSDRDTYYVDLDSLQ